MQKGLYHFCNAKPMQLMDTAFFITTAHDMRERQVGRIRRSYRVVQSYDAIGEEHRAVVVLAGKRVRAHESPVDIRRHLSKKCCVITSAEVVEDFGDATFVRVRGILFRRRALGAG